MAHPSTIALTDEHVNFVSLTCLNGCQDILCWENRKMDVVIRQMVPLGDHLDYPQVVSCCPSIWTQKPKLSRAWLFDITPMRLLKTTTAARPSISTDL